MTNLALVKTLLYDRVQILAVVFMVIVRRYVSDEVVIAQIARDISGVVAKDLLAVLEMPEEQRAEVGGQKSEGSVSSVAKIEPMGGVC